MKGKKAKQESKEYSAWENKYGHMTQYSEWDKKGRKCKNPKCEHIKLGVDKSYTPPILFCPFCFARYGKV